ncbi:MAG: hypothetical protein HYR84_10965, partial [Planctomycetes bacterium]|nr:hypothetical protein [Planctomycetota bacterium]
MSPRFFSSVFLCLALGWALHANRADAQPAAPPTAADKMLRVTYPVADLVVPIPGRAKAETREAIAANLIQLITKTIAPHSWEKPGAGTIQYFPMGMAIVVYQPQSVHEEITALLAALRRVVDEQVSIEMRLVTASPAMAKHLLLDMDEHGRVVRAVRDANATAHRFVSMDDKQIATFLTLAQSYQSTTILQTPKITLFNAQHARLSQTTPTFGDEAVPSSNSFTCALLPVLDAKREFVRLTLELQYQSAIDKGAQAIAANRTFVVAPGRTLVWHLGETVERRHLFVLATPRVVIDEPEERLFIGEIPLTPGRDEKPPMADPERRIDAMIARQIVKDGFLFLSANEPQKAKFLALKAKELNVRFAPGETTPDDLLREIERRANAGAEEQTIPDRQAPPRIHPKKAIEKRLRQPISLHFKNVPLQQAFKDLSSASGVAIRLDLRSLQDAKIDLDAPISLAVDDISMKSALNIMLDRLRLTYSVQDDGILISTEDKVRYYRVTYDVRDLIESAERVNHFSKKGDNVGETLMGLVQTSVARNTWEAQGGPGSVSYL